MPLSIGQLLQTNRYRIDGILGKGGMGAVYLAWDNSLGKNAAIKENLDTSAEAHQQFNREATMLARLSHPNLPRVTDYFFIPNQGQYLVMDYVEGEDLDHIINTTGSLPEAHVIPWILQVCDALIYLHNQKPPIIHRDIKPGNIRICPDGRAMLVDFGIAKVYDPHLSTTIGARAITPGYSPPEQYGSGKTDERSDIYALGATLYHVLTGKKLPESVHLMTGESTLVAPRQINAQISEEAEEAILRCIEVDTKNRYQSMGEVQKQLMKKVKGDEIADTVAVVVPTPVGVKKERIFPKWAIAGMGGVVVIVILVLVLIDGSRMFGLLSVAETATVTMTATVTQTATSLPITRTPTLTANSSRTPTTTITMRITSTRVFSTKTPTTQSTQTKITFVDPILQLDQNYHCRSGPGSNYETLRDLEEGETFSLYGWNGYNWYLVKLEDPTTRKKICWVGGGNLIQGDYEQLLQCEWFGDGYDPNPICK